MTGFLVLVGVLLAVLVLPSFFDRGSREHRFYRGQTEPWLGMLMRLEDAGVRFVDLWMVGRRLRAKSRLMVAVPVGVLILFTAVQVWSGIPALVTVGLAGLVVAVYGIWDESLLRGLGYLTRAVPSSDARWLLVPGFLGRLALALAGVFLAERGVAAINQGDWLAGLVSLVASPVLLGSAHVPSVHAERLALRWAGRRTINDDRGILLLRSFTDDDLRIRSGWTTLGRTRPILPLLPSRFEEFLATTLLGEDARLVALGRPGERLPELGAVRTYRPTEGWQGEVLRMAQHAKAVVIIAGLGEALTWEMRQLRTLGLISKVLVIIPPDNEQRSRIRLRRATQALTGVALEPPGYRYGAVTALSCNPSTGARYYLAPGRDWFGYVATIVWFFGVLNGTLVPPEDGYVTRSWERAGEDLAG